MDKDSRGKDVYLGLATVRVSGRQRPRTTNRNSLLPQQLSNPISTNLMSHSLKEIVNERVGDSLKSPISENNAIGGLCEGCTSGTSDGGGGNAMGGSDPQGLLITSTTSSNVNLNIGKDSKQSTKPATAPSVKKKRGHRRLGGMTKNQDDGWCFFLKLFLSYNFFQSEVLLTFISFFIFKL